MTQPTAGRNAGWMALCLAAGVLASLVWPLYLLLPALWAAAMFRTKPHWLALMALALLAAAYWLMGDWLFAVCLTALAALPALAIYLMQKRRVNNVYTAAVMAALAVAALYGIVCLPGVLSGEGAFTAVENFFKEVVSYAERTAAALPGMTEELLAAWTQYLELFEESVASLIVPALCGMACVLALSNLLFFRLLARKRDWGLVRLRPFAEWSVPQSMMPGLVVFLIASLAASCAGWEYAPGFSATINAVVSFPLMVQGLATIDFLILRARGNVNVIRALVYVGVGLLLSLLQSALMLLGCFDLVFHLRDRLRMARTQRPPMPPR